MLVAAHTTVIVDFDKPVTRWLNVEGLQAQPVQPRLAPGGGHDSFGHELRAVVQDETGPFGSQLSPDGRAIQKEADAVLAKDVGEGLSHSRLLAGNQAGGLLDDRDSRAESRKSLRDLASHRSTAEDQRRAGEIRSRVDFLACPDPPSVQPFDLGNCGDAADRDDQIGPANSVAVDIQSAGAHDASAPAVHDDSLGT